jgi:glutamate/aspartate transport system substrate-binding protein
MSGRILLLLAMLFSQPALAVDTLDKIRKSGVITIAHPANTPPFSFMDGGEPTGYSINLCRQVVDNMALQLGMQQIRINWRTASTPDALQLVADGSVDMGCGTTSITLSRQEKVDFSNEIYVATGGLLVNSRSGISNLAGLNDKRIAVIRGTTTQGRLSTALGQRGLRAILVPVSNTDEGMQALGSGKADAYATDREILLGYLKASGDSSSRYALLAELFSVDPYALVLPRGDSDFRLAVNRGLSDVYRNASLDDVFGRWFGPGAEPSHTLRTIYLLNSYQD